MRVFTVLHGVVGLCRKLYMIQTNFGTFRFNQDKSKEKNNYHKKRVRNRAKKKITAIKKRVRNKEKITAIKTS